jgi:hypothetical protein
VNDYLEKMVSSALINCPGYQEAPPVQLLEPANLNESFMWQTMQSRIFDMTSIMQQIHNDPEARIPSLQSYNMVPSLTPIQTDPVFNPNNSIFLPSN